MRFSLVFVIFLVLEIFSIIKAGQWIGVLPALSLLLLGLLAGGYLINRQHRRGLTAGEGAPGAATLTSLLSNFLAGALFICPGFFSDSLALLVLLPASRRFLSDLGGQYFARSLLPRMRIFGLRHPNFQAYGHPFADAFKAGRGGGAGALECS